MNSLPSPLPDRLQLPWKFDATAMATEAADMVTADWIKHFVPQNYEGDWSVIPLRGPRGVDHPILMISATPGCREFEDTPFLERCGYLRQVLDTFKCPLQSVRLMRLGPGSHIKEHRDHDLAFEQGNVRLHVPITTNSKVTFRLNQTSVDLMPGSCWYLRLSDLHEVVNHGETDRIHLVIDATVDRWLKTEFHRACLNAN